MTSSVRPSAAVADERIVWLMLSPVDSAAAMITVPSIDPTTISALRAGRRRTLRTPRRTSTGLRRARIATAPSTTTRMMLRTTASVPTGIPNNLVMAARLPSADDGGDVRDGDVVHLAAWRSLEDGHELPDLLAVEAVGNAGLSGRLVAPERYYQRLALRRRQNVAAFIPVLLVLCGHHCTLVELDEVVEALADDVDLRERDSCDHVNPPPGTLRRRSDRRPCERCDRS